MIRIKNDESGVALIIALIIAFIILALGGMALYISTESTRISGEFKQYRNSMEAALGAYNETDRIIRLLMTSGAVVTYPSQNILIDKKISCLRDKLNTPTSRWVDIANNDGCPSLTDMESANVNDIIDYYDLKYKMGNYDVYVKIVNSTEGNTSFTSANGRTVGGTTSNKRGVNIVNPPHNPYLYTMEIVSESTLNPNDKASVSLLYGY